MSSDQRLIQASAMLARAAPQAWEAFLQAMAERVGEASNQLVASELVTLQVNQGRAQAYGAMFRLFRDAVKTQDDIERGTRRG